MIIEINNVSSKKQYLERDNLLLADNDEILRIDCKVQNESFRFPTIFTFVCTVLELNKWEREIYYMLNYRRDEFDSFYHMTKVAARLFNRSERGYNKYYRDLEKRGIVVIDKDNRPHIGKQYDIENFTNKKYVVLKIDSL